MVKHYGIPDKLINIICSFFEDMLCQVVHNSIQPLNTICCNNRRNTKMLVVAHGFLPCSGLDHADNHRHTLWPPVDLHRETRGPGPGQ